MPPTILGGKNIMTVRNEAEELAESLPDDLDASVDEIESSLNQLVTEFDVPLEEAVRSTRNTYMDDYDGDEEINEGSGSGSPSSPQDEDYDIGDLTVDQDEEWMNIRGTVQELFDLSNDQKSWMTQKGIIADDTGTTVFTVPDEAIEENESQELEVGETYSLQAVVGDAYQGRIGVKLTSTTTVTKLDETYTPPENDSEITGSIVDIQEKSGLIKRCPKEECTHVLSDGKCPTHGEVDGEFDLRLKTIIDDGEKAHSVFFGAEATEALTGISLDEAIEIAEDAMQMEAVLREMKPMLLGRYYSIAGNDVGEFVIVNNFQRVQHDDWTEQAQDLLDSLHSSDGDEDSEVAA